MANETLNGTLDAALNATGQSLLERASGAAVGAGDYVPLVLERMWDLMAAPFHHPEMWWVVFHLLLTLLVLEFYFDRHRDEELGWAAAVANSLVLFIIAIDLIRHSFHEATPWGVLRTITLAVFTDATLPVAPQVLVLILFVGIVGAAVTVINYYHLLPRKLAFEVSGHPPINFIAYLAIAIVYTHGSEHEIPLDIPTLIAGAVVFVLILFAVFLIRRHMAGVGEGRRRW